MEGAVESISGGYARLIFWGGRGNIGDVLSGQKTWYFRLRYSGKHKRLVSRSLSKYSA